MKILSIEKTTQTGSGNGGQQIRFQPLPNGDVKIVGGSEIKKSELAKVAEFLKEQSEL